MITMFLVKNVFSTQPVSFIDQAKNITKEVAAQASSAIRTVTKFISM